MKQLSQRSQTILIVTVVLVVAVVILLVTGEGRETLDDVATIWDYLF